MELASFEIRFGIRICGWWLASVEGFPDGSQDGSCPVESRLASQVVLANPAALPRLCGMEDREKTAAGPESGSMQGGASSGNGKENLGILRY